MLLPGNASRLVRLHRLAALGMAIADDTTTPLSASAVRALLKREDIGSSRITSQEDPFAEVLVQSISFFGGEYLVSPGFGEGTVADVENLADAAFREEWMPTELRGSMRQLIQGLLTVSNLVLTRAGLARGTRPGRTPRTPVQVPSASKLDALAQAAFLSHDDLEAHGPWLRMVVDTFALDPGDLTDPCADDIVDDRLLMMPFLRLRDGYQVAVPLDLLLTIRYHMLRFTWQEAQQVELGKRYRAAALRRIERLLPHDAKRKTLSETALMNRYLVPIDEVTELHVIVASDPLTDWSPDEMWGTYDTQAVLDRVRALIQPSVRSTYSSATTVLHLVVTDSPGRSAFWGVPNVDGAEPVLIARADDLEVMLHGDPDGALGLLYFAEAIDRRPGGSMSTNILDEYSSYEGNEKSFYISDESQPTFIVFETGDGYFEREKFFEETDRHGIEAPVTGRPIVQFKRRYKRDAPEIFTSDTNASFIGYVVEVGNYVVFVSADLDDERSRGMISLLLETVSFWVRECIVRADLTPAHIRSHLVVSSSSTAEWTRPGHAAVAENPVLVTRGDSTTDLLFTDLFAAQLREVSNVAERNLVAALLMNWFAVDAQDVDALLDVVVPQGSKRMLYAFNQSDSPAMQAGRLPAPVTGHGQVTAQILDELGEWLRDPGGADLSVGPVASDERSGVLNKAVEHLFALMEDDIARYDQRALLEYLVLQNEALASFATYNAQMLRSRLACFGSHAETTKELVEHRSESAIAHRANRFLIEYVAAQPPQGQRLTATRDYRQLLGLAEEIIERGTASDFLYYQLADFDVSILRSGRLGTSRDEPVEKAMTTYVEAAGARAVRTATEPPTDDTNAAPASAIVKESAAAMRSEYGFTLTDLREVCHGLLDLGTSDQVTRIDRKDALDRLAADRDLAVDVVDTVLTAITLTPRDEFMSIGPDAVPWRFNRNMSYVRRPLVLQDDQLVFGFRSVLNTPSFWFSSLTSGRLQANAKTQAMKAYISEVRGRINNSYASDVADRLRSLGLTAELSVNKIAGARIADSGGMDLGDVDVLAWHPRTRTVLAVEAKDFEVARTPAELSHEIDKLFIGKRGKKAGRSTVEKHARRVEWLRTHLAAVLTHIGVDAKPRDSTVAGHIVTSEPLVTPLVTSSTIPVIAFEDLDLDTLGIGPSQIGKSRRRRR